MSVKRLNMRMLLLYLLLGILSSCVLDFKSLGYCVKNSTKDTLLIDLTESDTLNDEMYWNLQSRDSIGLISTDTISVYICGKKVVIFSFYCVAPEAKSGGFLPKNSDTLYLYTIKWNVAKSYTLEEIRMKKLYNRRRVTKKEFKNHVFEYK